MKRICVLFAGGESKRFGSPKALAKYMNRSFLEISLENLSHVCSNVIVSVSEKTPVDVIEHVKKYRHEYNIMLVYDSKELPCRGPPRGFVSSVISVKDNFEAVIILGIDYPYLKWKTLQKFVELSSSLDAEASTILLQKGFPSITIGYIRMDQAKKFVNICKVKKGLTRLTDLYRCSLDTALIGWSLLSENPLEFLSVNTPEQLKPGYSLKVKNTDVIARLNNVECIKFIESLSRNDLESAISYLKLEIEKYERLGLTLFKEHAEKDLRMLRDFLN